MLGLVIVIAFILLAVFAAWIAPMDPIATSWSAIRKAPSAEHWFGTDEIGRDVLSRVIWGTRASLLAGVVSVSISLLIGVPIGHGCRLPRRLGGRRHLAHHRRLPRLSLPDPGDRAGRLPGPQPDQRHGGDRRVRRADLRAPHARAGAGHQGGGLRGSARAVGNPPLRIALRHILPNITAPLMVQATLAIAAAVIAEASLSFLGLGQQPPAPSWGSMLNTAKNFIDNAPWMAIWPGVAIFLLVLSFNLLGDGLRDALDPRGG
jgi:peptide/nickel transport system permease protein